MSSIHSLRLRDFRCYTELQLALQPGITVFTGRNGVGKTTLLEAVALLGSGRSFRQGRNLDFLRRGAETAFLEAEIESQGLRSEVKASIHPNGKKFFLNGKLARSTEALHQLLPVIVFSPADHGILEGDAADRRQFLNRAIATVDWGYVETSTQFNKVLLQRNRILKDAGRESWSQNRLLDVLAAWDEQLVQLGSQLILQRKNYLFELAPWMLQEYRRISRSDDTFAAHYFAFGEEQQPREIALPELCEIFRAQLSASLRADLATGNTQVGPHKDEILLTLNANKVKFYGSQGEKRTCALALRLGELALFRSIRKRPPLLLFDDVSSELDKVRRQSLVELLSGEELQVWITATELPSTLLTEAGKSFAQIDLDALEAR